LTLREDVAEELMQDLFIRLSRMPDLHKVANWDAYARRAAIHLAFDWRRRHQQPPASLDEVAEPASSEGSPLRALMHDEQIQEVLSVIGQINGSARQAFVMRYIEQDSYDSIAQHLGKTPQQIRALCSRVMKYIRVQLARKDPMYDGKGVADAGT
jgi:RNA polymerase sigma-70 factor (ECF subfamily)